MRSKFRRVLSKAKFIGITGSSAKSTTTALLGNILASCKPTVTRVLSNQFESHLATLRSLGRDDAFAVFECGVGKPRDMDATAALLRPHIAIVTMVGIEHYSSFRSREAVAREKGKLVEAIQSDGFAVLNADDPYVMEMANRTSARIVTVGREKEADYRVVRAQCEFPGRLHVEIVWGNNSTVIETKLIGEHFWLPVALAFAASVEIGVSQQQIKDGLGSMSPIMNRCYPMSTAGGPSFILDAEKAPWETLGLAFDVIAKARFPHKRIILGSISDYPGNPNRKYRDAYRMAREVADQVIFVGEHAHRSKASPEDLASERFVAFRTVREVYAYLKDRVSPEELILVKGSKFMHMERIALAFDREVRCWEDRCGYPRDCLSCGKYETPYSEHE